MERLFAVRIDLRLNVGDVVLLCLGPYPCSRVLHRRYSLWVLVSAPIENPESPCYSEQSDLDWPPALMLPKLNEM